jgi:hypothetical protein
MRRALALPLLLSVAVSQSISLFAPAPCPAGPSLSISMVGTNQVSLNWAGTNDWLQTAPFVGSSFPWVNVGSAPMNSVALPRDKPAQFFRLVTSPILPPPTELQLQTESDTNGDYYFDVSWDAVPGAVSYNLYMATVPGVTSANYSSLPGGAAFSGISNIFASVPDVPGGVFTPVLTAGQAYYFVATAVSSTGVESADSNPASGIFGPGGEVEGSVFAELNLGSGPAPVLLPNVLLTLVNTNNSALSNSVTSDENGDFQFPPMPAGTYQLCWQANGFTPACSNQIVIANAGVELSPIQLFPAVGGVVFGQVAFQDGSPVFDVDSSFGINVDPTVVLMDSNNTVVATATVNSDSQYVMAGVPQEANMSVSVTVENASARSNIDTHVTGEADLFLPDTAPVIQSFVATTNGAPVQSVPPGTTVLATVTAKGNNLNYEWFDLHGPLAYPNASNVLWSLPTNAVGFQYLWVRVSDAHGGYAVARLDLTVSPFVFFDGTVLGSDTGAPLSNAVVQLNGVVTNTDTNGYFSFELNTTNEYDLSMGAPGYVPLSRVYFDPVSDQSYTLLAISTPGGPYCPVNPPLTWVTNCANGVRVAIPTDGLMDTNDNPYFGCIDVSLDSLDPCDPANGFASGSLDTNGAPLQPFGLVNITVTDLGGGPLHLAPGFSADVFIPASLTCQGGGALPTDAEFFTQPGSLNNEWTPVADAVLATNEGCVLNYVGYDGEVGGLGLLACGAAAAPAPQTLGPIVLRFVVDDSLHIPITVGYFFDNNGKPGKQFGDYQIITENQEGVRFRDLQPGVVIWIEVLSMRQSPGNYYGNGRANLLPVTQKDVIQTLKFIAPATTPAKDLPCTIGLGSSVDLPRSAVLLNLSAAQTAGLAERFLRRPGAEGNFNPTEDYYKKIDPPDGSSKDTFAKWQTANGWPGTPPKIGKGDTAYAVYFNANDLGAGRRMGMKTFTEDDGKASVAYYVATYATLADAVEDEKAGRQPGNKGSKLKYIVCMEYSRTLNNGMPVTPDRYIKFYAYDKLGNRTGMVEDESRALSLPVPYVCMVCHGGATGVALHAPPPRNKMILPHGDVKGKFVPFDRANYTFSSAFPPAKPHTVFAALNEGLITGQASADPTALQRLIQKMVLNDGFTTDTSAMPNWGKNPNAPTPAEVSLYNDVYAVSCRSCHVTQTGSRNWQTASDFLGDLNSQSRAPATRIPVMPHAQRTYGIYWGSATARWLNDQAPQIINQPTIVSQPATGPDDSGDPIPNEGYFVVPPPAD